MVCGADGSIRLWSIGTGNPIRLILDDYGLNLTCVDHAFNRQWLAQGTITEGVRIVHIPLDAEPVIINKLTVRVFMCSILKTDLMCCTWFYSLALGL